jgi:endonuclease YncB( thermonuclease family)
MAIESEIIWLRWSWIKSLGWKTWASKYGRLLCDVFVEDTNLHVNSAMIESGFAVAFMV